MSPLSRLSGSYVPRVFNGLQAVLKSMPTHISPSGSYLLNREKANIQNRKFFTVIYEYEKGVTFTLGKLTSVKEPGFRIVVPFLQWMWKADMRVNLENLHRQDVITSDNVTIKVDGVVQYRVVDPAKAICNVDRVGYYRRGVDSVIKELAQLKLREELSHHDVNEILNNRELLSRQLLEGTQKITSEWGIELQSIRIKDIIFDESMTRAMAKKAEAERIAEAKMINAEVDVKTAKKYEEASAIYKNDPTAMRLRELEAFTRMASEPSNMTILIPAQILDVIKDMRK